MPLSTYGATETGSKNIVFMRLHGVFDIHFLRCGE